VAIGKILSKGNNAMKKSEKNLLMGTFPKWKRHSERQRGDWGTSSSPAGKRGGEADTRIKKEFRK